MIIFAFCDRHTATNTEMIKYNKKLSQYEYLKYKSLYVKLALIKHVSSGVTEQLEAL